MQKRKSPPQPPKSPSPPRKSPSQPRKSPSPPRKSSPPPVFSYEIYMNQQANIIKQFIKDKIVSNKNSLKNRINRYKLLTKQLSLLKDGDCLEEKKKMLMGRMDIPLETL